MGRAAKVQSFFESAMTGFTEQLQMIHYENHAYYVHEKCFSKGYKFVKIVLRDDVPVYKIEWKSLVSVLESPVIKSINLQ